MGTEVYDWQICDPLLCRKSCCTRCLLPMCQENVRPSGTRQVCYLLGTCFPIPNFSSEWSKKWSRKGPILTTSASGIGFQFTIPSILTKKAALSRQELWQSRPWRRYRNSKNHRHIFVSIGRNFKKYAEIGLAYTHINCLITFFDTVAGPRVTHISKLPTVFEIQLSIRPLPNILHTSTNLLEILGIIKLVVNLGHTQRTLYFVFYKTLPAFVSIDTEFFDLHVKQIRPEQKLVEQDSGDRIPNEPTTRRRKKSQPQLTDDLPFTKQNPRPSPVVQVHKKQFSIRTHKHGYPDNSFGLSQPC